MGDSESAVSWDLTSSVSPYLDLHMMFPLLEYVDSLIATGATPYSSSDIAAARLSLLRPTHMVDYAMDIYRELHGPDAKIPEEMDIQKEQVFVKMEDTKNANKVLEDLFENHELRVSFIFFHTTFPIVFRHALKIGIDIYIKQSFKLKN